MVTENDPNWHIASWRSDVRRRLLAWFGKHARVLPWRSEPTPYRVWVSEIMLQQTQVATVLPYFERFIQRLPDVHSLAAIEEQELMRLWEGLGYYRRARSLHAAAKKIVSDHGGEFPAVFDQVLALPGIGRYTAGAILSISGDQRLPILEGNTQRVFSRLIGLRENPLTTTANRMLWQFAEAMLPREGSGTFNQASMELGALVCTPTAPDCEHCPLLVRCAAASLGLQSEIPGKLSRVKYEDRVEYAFVIANARGDKFLLQEIPHGRRWSGMWDFPRTSDQTLISLDEALGWISRSEGIDAVVQSRLFTVKHAVTRFRITLHVHSATLHSSPADRTRTRAPKGWKFVSRAELRDLPLSVTGRQIATKLDAIA